VCTIQSSSDAFHGVQVVIKDVKIGEQSSEVWSFARPAEFDDKYKVQIRELDIYVFEKRMGFKVLSIWNIYEIHFPGFCV
jgi:hypothetical protein